MVFHTFPSYIDQCFVSKSEICVVTEAIVEGSFQYDEIGSVSIRLTL